jgi:KDO2-lipid IV(A) lauroyltransferase
MLYPVVFNCIDTAKRLFSAISGMHFLKKLKKFFILARSFYRNFCDVLVETLKMLHFTDKELARHIEYSNPEILLDLYNKGKSVIVVAAHYGNWEWMAGLRIRSPYHTIAVYKPLNSRIFDRIMKQLRTRFGVEVVPMRNILRVLTQMPIKASYSLLFYFRPVAVKKRFNTGQHFSQDTPVILDENIAAKTNQQWYLGVQIIRRGYYQVHITLLSKILPLCLHMDLRNCMLKCSSKPFAENLLSGFGLTADGNIPKTHSRKAHLTRRFIYCSIMKKYLQAIIFWFFYPVLRIFMDAPSLASIFLPTYCTF